MTATVYPHAVAAELELLVGLRRAGASSWGLARWRRFLRPLKPKWRRVVLLRVLFGMEFSDIAERIGSPTRQATDHLYRNARRKLRKLGWDE